MAELVAVDAPDWLINAGAIRDVVWDRLHGREPEMPRDVDMGFFDPDDLTPERDEAVDAALRALEPDVPWEAKNQAALHLWYPQRFGIEVPPFRSSAEAVATFPVIAPCVGVRLPARRRHAGRGPHGLHDFFDCICRHNPTRAPASLYDHRVATKGRGERWPKMRYVPSG